MILEDKCRQTQYATSLGNIAMQNRRCIRQTEILVYISKSVRLTTKYRDESNLVYIYISH